jgi:N-acetylmuramic acid 6-phosphate etherase
MKAGTAQRITLTLLSTLLMILLGRVYEGLMVDVQVVNQKLVRRSEDMLMQLTGRHRDEVRTALHRAEGSVKLAVMLLNGCDVAEARTLLERSRGHLRAALALAAQRSTHAA